MPNQYKENPVAKRNKAICDQLCYFIRAANTEQNLRLLFQFGQAVFKGYAGGLMVSVEKAKAERKFQLGLPLTERDRQLIPQSWLPLQPGDADYEPGFQTHTPEDEGDEPAMGCADAGAPGQLGTKGEQDDFEQAEMEGRL